MIREQVAQIPRTPLAGLLARLTGPSAYILAAYGVRLVRCDELRHLPEQVRLDRGYFRRDALEKLIREHRAGTEDHSLRLWAQMQLEMWHREVVGISAAPTETRH